MKCVKPKGERDNSREAEEVVNYIDIAEEETTDILRKESLCRNFPQL
jgi:hypothetical protein